MNYPLLKNQLPVSIKKVWKKTSLTTFVVFQLLGIGVISVFMYFEILSGMWNVVFSVYFVLVFVTYLLNFLLINYRYQYFRYEITSKEVVFQEGFIFRSITYVPFTRIQHIETEQGPFLRRENLMELVIHTAATAHHIAGLSIEDSEKLRQSLLLKVEEGTEDE
ncbi:PH domain-containing protein [Carnobacterium funditum]|uniref:PH domain-containing protein n=1 Tax=Carnobacterium funditum TaxID=2752 RepID=UPI00054DA8AE|nr:PH domain-containing protein [Carnobacterium funditum]